MTEYYNNLHFYCHYSSFMPLLLPWIYLDWDFRKNGNHFLHDTTVIVSLSKHISGLKYLLVCINVFSRYLQVVPLKAKSAKDTLEGLKQILESTASKGYTRLMTDQLGGEFYNSPVKQYLKSKCIKLYSRSSREIKAAIAERVFRTLKEKCINTLLLRILCGILTCLKVKTYNNTPHRSLGLLHSPNIVHSFKEQSQFAKQFRLMYINKKNKKKKKKIFYLIFFHHFVITKSTLEYTTYNVYN